jgi:3-phenylpropionate/trans-cinnamate dioxygenase ferredoxin subunit
MPLRYIKVYDFKQHGNEPQQINTPRTIAIDGKRICLVRLADGYFAVDDRCPHAGASLGSGRCDEEGHVICPVHRYRYDVKTGKGLPKQGDYVETYPVKETDEGVFIGIEKKWWQIF